MVSCGTVTIVPRVLATPREPLVPFEDTLFSTFLFSSAPVRRSPVHVMVMRVKVEMDSIPEESVSVSTSACC